MPFAPDVTAAPWRPDPGTPPLHPGQVHVWAIPLDPPAEALPALRALLDEAERARADRFVFAEHRRRFTVGRAATRLLCARYLGIEAPRVAFHPGPRGKLYLGPELAETPLQMNLSHSGDLALLAFTQGRQVGVDVEARRVVSHGDRIAAHHFAPAEVAQLPPALDAEAWHTAFFNTWTRKEAFIKLTGEGLHRPLDSFEVSLLPGDRPRLVRVDDDHAPEARFTLLALDPGPGYAAALAVEGGVAGVALYRWECDAVPRSGVSLPLPSPTDPS